MWVLLRPLWTHWSVFGIRCSLSHHTHFYQVWCKYLLLFLSYRENKKWPHSQPSSHTKANALPAPAFGAGNYTRLKLWLLSWFCIMSPVSDHSFVMVIWSINSSMNPTNLASREACPMWHERCSVCFAAWINQLFCYLNDHISWPIQRNIPSLRSSSH